MAFADDNMSDDVFLGPDEEGPTSKDAKKPPPHPSPTGYRDYKPPLHLLKKNDDYEVLHKVRILLNKRFVLFVKKSVT